MAIESLRDWVFSGKSDVWSFGVVLWEMFSLAKVPYTGLVVDDEFIRRLENGYRMEKPEFMPEDIGRLMTDCWKPEPHQRPTFTQLTESLGVYMETTVGCANYLQMNNVFIEKDVPVPSINDDSDNSDVLIQNQEMKREDAIDALRSSSDYVLPLTCSGSSAINTDSKNKKSFTLKLKKLSVMSARNSIRSTDQTKTTTT